MEECNSCFKLSNETKLYHCLFPNCPHLNILYCHSCGQTIHRNIIDHKFASISNAHDGKTPTDTVTNKPTTSKDSLINFSSLISWPTKDKIKKCEDAATTVLASQNPIYALGSVGLQVAHVSYDYYHNEIIDDKGNKDKSEYGRLLLKSSSMPTTSFLCGVAAKVMFLSTGFGWVAAIGYGILGSVLTQKAFEKYLPDSKQKLKELKLTALQTFQFFAQDMANKDIFNKKTVEKRYKKLAKKYHPDGKYGSKEKFQELEVYHRIVLSMLDDDTVFPMVKFNENGVVCFDSTSQPKPIEFHKQKNYSNNDDYDDTECIVM